MSVWRLLSPIFRIDLTERLGSRQEELLQHDTPTESEDHAVNEHFFQSEPIGVLRLGPVEDDRRADDQVDHRGQEDHGPEIENGRNESVEERGDDHQDRQHGSLLGRMSDCGIFLFSVYLYGWGMSRNKLS